MSFGLSRLITGESFDAPKGLRELIERGIVCAPGVCDAISGRIVEEVGFEAAYMSGGATATALGLPDVGVRTHTELVFAAKVIASALNIPLIVDGDTGFGGVFNVARLVRDMENVGVAGIHLEDQELPKRCGHLSGKRLIPANEHAAKIKAATEARCNKDFLIIARIDALSVTGFDDAIYRGKCYLDAGADVLFFDGIDGIKQLEMIPKALPPHTCLLANLVEGGKTPLVSWADLQEMGYRIVIWPLTAFGAAITAMREVLEVLKEEQTTTSVISRIGDLRELHRFQGWNEAERFTEKYSTL